MARHDELDEMDKAVARLDGEDVFKNPEEARDKAVDILKREEKDIQSLRTEVENIAVRKSLGLITIEHGQIQLVANYDEAIESLNNSHNGNKYLEVINNLNEELKQKNPVANERITTILNADFNENLYPDMLAEIIFIDSLDKTVYRFDIINEEPKDDGDFHIGLSTDNNKVWSIHDIFDEETTEKIENAVRAGESIHVSNPTVWFNFDYAGDLFDYMEKNDLSENLNEHTYLYMKTIRDEKGKPQDKLYLNASPVADIENFTMEVSPYDFTFQNDSVKNIVKDKTDNLKSAYLELSIDDLGLEKLFRNTESVITEKNDIYANDKAQSLILATSAINVDKELMNSAYKLHDSFSEYYNSKLNIEDNPIIKAQFKDRLENIENYKADLSHNLLNDTNTDRAINNAFDVYSETTKDINDTVLNMSLSHIPQAIKNDIEYSFNQYKSAAADEMKTLFNNLSDYQQDESYIDVIAAKTLDKTYLNVLEGTQSIDYYRGMKDFAKLNQSNTFEDYKQEAREQNIDKAFTMKTYLSNKHSLDTDINLDKSTLSTLDKKVSFNFSEISNQPERSLSDFERYSKENSKPHE